MSTIGTRVQANGLVFGGLASQAYPQEYEKLLQRMHNDLRVEGMVHNGYQVAAQYHNAVLVFGKEEEDTVPASNIVTISNPNTSTVTNAPIRIGQQFKQGEIKNYPAGRINGIVFNTQANVKTRWPDGSAKHVILSFILFSVSDNVSIDFINSDNGNNIPLTKAEMLDDRFDLDALMHIDFKDSSVSVSAREILNASKYELWNEGQVATTAILRDYELQAYSIGKDKCLWPSFEVTFWNEINVVEVRYVMESPNTETLQDEVYDIALTLGNMVLYTKADFYHRGFSRWTKKYWSVNYPDLNRDIGIQQNIDANAFPNYDVIKTAENDIASYYADWLTLDRDLGDVGKWKANQGSTGGREDIGPMPCWNTRWLMDGDYRHREIALKQADLAGNWSLNIREGRSGWTFSGEDNYAKQLTIDTTGRTGQWTVYKSLGGSAVQETYKIKEITPCLNSYVYHAFEFDTIVDYPVGTPVNYNGVGGPVETTIKQIIQTGNTFIISFQDLIQPDIGETFQVDTGSGWVDSGTNFASLRYENWQNDSAHFPNYSAGVYFAEGDYYYLEQLLNDAAYLIGDGNPGVTTVAGRGRTSAEGRLSGTQTRGVAWRLNVRLSAQELAPDGHYFKDYVTRLNKNAIAFLAGETASGNPYPADSDLTAMYNFGRDTIQTTRYAVIETAGPLGFLKDSGYTIKPEYFDETKVSEAINPNQHNFLVYAVGRAKELGLSTDVLISNLGKHIHKSWDYDDAVLPKTIMAAYNMGSLDINAEWFTDFANVVDAYNPDYLTELAVYVAQDESNIESGDRYDVVARAAASFMGNQPNWTEVWQWFEDNVNYKQAYLVNPKYAINPRK